MLNDRTYLVSYLYFQRLASTGDDQPSVDDLERSDWVSTLEIKIINSNIHSLESKF